MSKPRSKAAKLPPGFTRLSPCVSLYDPTSNPSSSPSITAPPPPPPNVTNATPLPSPEPLPLPAHTQPTLLILCTWANASPTHIAKYTTPYRALLPRARILLIQGTMYDLMFRPDSPQRPELAAAVEVVRAAQAEEVARRVEGGKAKEGPHGILVHILSSGGVHKATLLARMLRTSPSSSASSSTSPAPTSSSSSPPPSGLHPRAILIDSAPTLGRDTRAFFVPAMLASFPRLAPPLWLLAVVAMNAFWCLLWTMATFGVQNPVERVAGRLVEPGVFDEESTQGREKTRWGYVYSEADKVVGVEDVRWHVARARDMGRVVAIEKCFQKSGHVNHLKEEGGVYWDLLAELLSGDGVVGDGGHVKSNDVWKS